MLVQIGVTLGSQQEMLKYYQISTPTLLSDSLENIHYFSPFLVYMHFPSFIHNLSLDGTVVDCLTLTLQNNRIKLYY